MDDILGLAIIKVLDKNTQNTMMLELKFIHYLAMLNVTNIALETVIINPQEMIGILRSVGYYKLK